MNEGREGNMDWIKELEQARATLFALRESIRGNTPSQIQMDEKLVATIAILDAQIIVEGELMP